MKWAEVVPVPVWGGMARTHRPEGATPEQDIQEQRPAGKTDNDISMVVGKVVRMLGILCVAIDRLRRGLLLSDKTQRVRRPKNTPTRLYEGDYMRGFITYECMYRPMS